MKGLDWSCLRCYSSTGEASAPEDVLWLMARGGYKPVIEYCGGELHRMYLSKRPGGCWQADALKELHA
jgi:acyl-coenzyme A synthetase/AMP-(fatty) acid ligase